MLDKAVRFPIRFDRWYEGLSRALLLSPSQSYVEIEGTMIGTCETAAQSRDPWFLRALACQWFGGGHFVPRPCAYPARLRSRIPRTAQAAHGERRRAFRSSARDQEA